MTVKVASINSKMYGLVVVDGLYTIRNISLPFINIVLLIEGLIHNLLIISILNYNGYNVVSNEMTCNVISKKNGYVIFSGTRMVDKIQSDDLSYIHSL